MSKNKYWDSIEDMPIKNWFKCIESDKSWVLIDRNSKDIETEEHKLQFEKLYCEFIDTFGINENLKEIISLQNEILVHKIDLQLTGDKTIKILIKMREIDLEAALKETDGGNNNKTIVMVEKWLGFGIDENKCSVRRFYEYLEAIKQDNGRG